MIDSDSYLTYQKKKKMIDSNEDNIFWMLLDRGLGELLRIFVVNTKSK